MSAESRHYAKWRARDMQLNGEKRMWNAEKEIARQDALPKVSVLDHESGVIRERRADVAAVGVKRGTLSYRKTYITPSEDWGKKWDAIFGSKEVSD